MNEKAIIVWLIIVSGLLFLSMVVCIGSVIINHRQELDIDILFRNFRGLEDYVDGMLRDDERKQKRDMIYITVMEEFMKIVMTADPQSAVRSKQFMEVLLLDAMEAYNTMEKLYKHWEAKDEEAEAEEIHS